MKRRTRLRAPEHGTLDVASTVHRIDREPHERGLRNTPATGVAVGLLAPHPESPVAAKKKHGSDQQYAQARHVSHLR
jgi:hypothetical protein